MVRPFEPDLFAQIAGLDLAAVDLHRRDIGADRADIIGDGFGQQRASIVGVADDGGIDEIGRPAFAQQCARSQRRPRCG